MTKKTDIQKKASLQPIVFIGGPTTSIPDAMTVDEINGFYLGQAKVCNHYGYYAIVPELNAKQFSIHDEFLGPYLTRHIGASSMVTVLNQYGSFAGGSFAETSRILNVPLVVFVHKDAKINPILKKQNLLKIISFRNFSDALEKFDDLLANCEMLTIDIPGIIEK